MAWSARNQGCSTRGALICATAPSRGLICTMSCAGGGLSCAARVVAATVGAGAEPPGRTTSGTAGCVRVRYFFWSGSKKLNDTGGTALISGLCGTMSCSNVLVPCKPSASVVSTLVVGGYVLNSRQALCSGRVSESNAPRPEIWILTVTGSPAATLVGPALTVIEKLPTAPLKLLGTFSLGTGSTVSVSGSADSATRRSSTCMRRNMPKGS